MIFLLRPDQLIEQLVRQGIARLTVFFERLFSKY